MSKFPVFSLHYNVGKACMNIARKYTGEERVTIMDTNILLENGTNELEVLEFTLAGNHYGINVAKIREILTYQPVTPIPNAHPSVEVYLSCRFIHLQCKLKG